MPVRELTENDGFVPLEQSRGRAVRPLTAEDGFVPLETPTPAPTPMTPRTIPTPHEPTLWEHLFGVEDPEAGRYLTGFLPTLGERLSGTADFGDVARRLPGGIKESLGAMTTEMIAGARQYLAEDRARRMRAALQGDIEGAAYSMYSPEELERMIAEQVAAATEHAAVAREARLGAEEALPEDAGLLERALQQGAATAGVVLAATLLGGPPGAVALLGAGRAGARYSQLREAGVPHEQAERSAVLLGSLEGLTEYFPAGTLVKRMPGFKARLAEFFATELPGENINTAAELVDDYVQGLRDDLTLQDFVDAFAETTVQTVVGGGVQVGMAQLLHETAARANALAERRRQPGPQGPLALPSPVFEVDPSGVAATAAQRERLAEELGLTPDVQRAAVEARAAQEAERAAAERAAVPEPAALPAPDTTLYVDPEGRVGRAAEFDARRRAIEGILGRRQTEREALGLTPDIEANLARLEARRPPPEPEIPLGDQLLALPPADTTIYVDPSGRAGTRTQHEEFIRRVNQEAREARALSEELGLTPDVLAAQRDRGPLVRPEELPLGEFAPPFPRPTTRPEPAPETGTPPAEPVAPVKRSRKPDPRVDSLLEYVSKKGGLSIDEARAQGIDPAHFKWPEGGAGIRRPFTKKGMSFDAAAEMLREAGWQVEGPNDLLNLIDDELRGRKHYSLLNEAAGLELERKQADLEREAIERQVYSDRRSGERAGPGRRRDYVFRKQVAAMTREELERALLTSEKTGLPNRRAFMERGLDKKPFKASIDIDSFKWVNDTFSHDDGDEVLRVLGEAMQASGLPVFHVSGDEFLIAGDSEQELHDIMEALREVAAKIEIELESPRHGRWMIAGLGLSYGIGRTLKEADDALQRDKDERAARGERARGGQPPGTYRIGPSVREGQDEGRRRETAGLEAGGQPPGTYRIGPSVREGQDEDRRRETAGLEAEDDFEDLELAEQPDLFYGEEDLRPGATPEQLELGRRLLKEQAERLRRDGPISTVAVAFNTDFVQDHTATLLGRRLRTARDLGVLGQVFRDPRYETLRYFFLDEKGRVVGETGVSSRLPGSSAAFPGTHSVEWVRDQMKRVGATQLWLLHNHPSGVSDPSSADIAVTTLITRVLNIPITHVVVDSNEYSVIETRPGRTSQEAPEYRLPALRVKISEGPDPILTPKKPHPVLNRRIRDHLDVARIAREFASSSDWLTVVALSAREEVRAIGDMPATLLDDRSELKKALHHWGLQVGSQMLYITGPDSDFIVRNRVLLRELQTEGYILDAVPVDGAWTFAQQFGPGLGARGVLGRSGDAEEVEPEREDLFGDDTRAQQALADEQRRRDLKRSPPIDVPADAGPGELFRRGRQLDIEDVSRRRSQPGKAEAEAEGAEVREAGPEELKRSELAAQPRRRREYATIPEMREAVRRMFADTENAPEIDFVDDVPIELRDRLFVSPGMTWAGAFDPITRRVYINLNAVYTVEDAVWTAAHEIAGHYGLLGLFDLGKGRKEAREQLNRALDMAAQNPFVDGLAVAIREQRRNLSYRKAVEEALSELAAATRTGDFERIYRRYGLEVPKALRGKQTEARSRLRRAIERFLERLDRIFFRALGYRTSNEQIRELLEGAWRYVKEGSRTPPSPRGRGREPVEKLEAFHGSPHRFDEFKLEAIGTGEGAQAYGWGLYFAESRRTGEFYRRDLAGRPEVIVGGERIETDFDIFDETATPQQRVAMRLADQYRALARDGDTPTINEVVQRTENELRLAVEREQNMLAQDHPRANERIVRSLEQQLEALPGMVEAGIEFRESGALYVVDIADEAIPKMLRWDDPIADQPEALKALQQAIGLSEGTVRYWTERLTDELAESESTMTERYLRSLIDEYVTHGGYGPRGRRVADEIVEALPESGQEFIDVVDRQGLGGIDYRADTGEQVYRMLEDALGSSQRASERLREAGIPGIVYWDQGSRDRKEGTRNFVVFDPSIVRIKSVNGEPVTKAESDRIIENTREDMGDELSLQEVDRRRGPRRKRPREPKLGRGPGRRAEDVVPSQKNDRGYQAMAQRVLDIWNERIGWRYGPLGKLPQKKTYLRERYLALGKVGESQEIGRSVYEALSKANAQDQGAVFLYLTTRNAKPDNIADEDVRAAAVRAKRLIDAVGQRLVAEGLLPQEAYEAHAGEYLPRVYLKHLLGERAFAAMGSGKRLSDMGYLKRRKDIPEDVRRIILGEITDPAFLASFGLTRTLRDLAIIDFLKKVAANREWVPPGATVVWNKQHVSPFWLRAEATSLRRRARLYAPENAALAREIADRMDAAAEEAIAKLGNIDLDAYEQIPDSPRYGVLRGMWVRTEIYNDLVGAQNFIPRNANWAEALLGQGGTLTKVQQWWKLSKVALNPPSQVRNFVSNMILLHLSGVPAHRVYSGEIIARAINSIRTKDKYYQIAKKYGLFQTTFSNQELRRIEDAWIAAKKLEGTGFARVRAFGAIIANHASDVYALMEAVGKIAKLRDAMGREGKSEADAMIEAHETLFDYSLVPRWVQYLRNAPLGAPFLTFMYKVLPRLGEVAIKHPLRLAPYVVLPWVMNALIEAMYDVDDDDIEQLRRAFPEWMNESGHMLLLPWKDQEGRWQVVDLGYILPWGAFTDALMKAGRGNVLEAAQDIGVFSGPIPDVITAMSTNRDPFTEQEIINPNDPPSEQLKQLLTYVWNLAMPSFVALGQGTRQGGAIARMLDARRGRVHPRTGEPTDTPMQAALRLFGINVYPVDPQASRQQNIRFMEFRVQDMEDRMNSLLRNRNLTAEERAEIREVYRRLIRAERDRIQQYRRESQIHPNLQRQERRER